MQHREAQRRTLEVLGNMRSDDGEAPAAERIGGLGQRRGEPRGGGRTKLDFSFPADDLLRNYYENEPVKAASLFHLMAK